MSASFRTISFTFEAVRAEYLSRTQRATQRPAILSMLQMEIYGKPYVRRIYIYNYINYIYIYRRGRSETCQCGARSGSPQILATDSFKREGNRTKRCVHYNLSPRQGYRQRKKE